MQKEDINALTTTITSIALAGMVGIMLGGITKVAVGKKPAQRLPQTRMITVQCPICDKVIPIPGYNAVTRSDALLKHIEQEHTSKVGLHPQALYIEGGETVSPEYIDLIGLINEPLPAYSLMTDLLPAVEVAPGEKKIDAVMRELKAGVEGIVDSDQFRLFLETMAKFHDYSIGNQMLIMLQKPGATRVAGFNTWKDMGRWVKSGEKGIAILAPIFSPRATCPTCATRIPKGSRFCPKCGESVDIEVEVSPRSFRVVHVFDVAQTEGDALPEIEVPALAGEVNEELFAGLLELMKKQGVTVNFSSRSEMDPEIKGYYSHGENLIWVRPEEPKAQQLKTLTHEVAHYFSEDIFRIPRADAETIAESAAYVVGAHYGFDSGVRSFPYVAIWAKDKKVLEKNLASIRQVSTTILDKMANGKYLPYPIPADDLKRIADKYGWWAARLAEAVCPHNDIACVEREANRLVKALMARH